MSIDPSKDPKNKPNVPPGWVAQFDEKYLTWFYVNLDTKKSQWEAPAGTLLDQNVDVPPPPYAPSSSRAGASGNYAVGAGPGNRAGDGYSRGPANAGYEQNQPQGGYQGGYTGNFAPNGQYGAGFTQQGFPQQGYPPQQYQSGYPQAMPGAMPQAYPPQGYSGYPSQQYQQPQTGSRFGGGSGMALGAGAGLLGGMMLSNAMHNSQMNAYEEGYSNGYDNGFDNGGDFGGGDFGGGDFGF